MIAIIVVVVVVSYGKLRSGGKVEAGSKTIYTHSLTTTDDDTLDD